jgi:hypothetical protein
MRIVKTRKGARMEQGGLILSEILRFPGPTDTLFDVLAACVAAVARGPDTLLLGFAGGGMVAPLRAMGFGHPIEAVDLSLEGEKVFRDLSEPWCGQVAVHEAEASAWLRASRRRYDTIIEDLSAPSPRGITKPDVALDVLPALMQTRLRPHGSVVVNVLPVPGMPWTLLLPQLAAPYAQARVITLEQWENRVLLLGDALDSARQISLLLRRLLLGIDSLEANGFSVRTLHG